MYGRCNVSKLVEEKYYDLRTTLQYKINNNVVVELRGSIAYKMTKH